MGYNWQNLPSNSLKIHRHAEMDPQNGKSCREREPASFCSRFNTNPPRLEAYRRSKSKQSPENSSEIDVILDWATKWWMPLPATQVVIDMLRSDELYCPLTNQVKLLQSPYFSAPSPHAINPTIPTQGHFVLSPVSLASRDQDDSPVELNDQHLISQQNSGLWTV